MLEDFLASLFSAYKPKIHPAPGLQRAAVLVPLFESSIGTGPLVVFTKRSENVRHHKGEVSFPGGLQEDGESLETTALRETQEELGASPFKIYGRLDDFVTITDYVVAPFVGYARQSPLWSPNKEVAKIIQVPLANLLKEELWESQIFFRGQQEILVHFFHWSESHTPASSERDTIWGATAHILRNFLTLLRSSTEVLDYLQSL
ncbi:MAG: NUDIX hydrolase [Candidatus Hodarchaeota archaeon]